MPLREKSGQYALVPSAEAGDDHGSPRQAADRGLPASSLHIEPPDSVSRRRHLIVVSVLSTTIVVLVLALLASVLRRPSDASSPRLSADFIHSGTYVLRTFEESVAFGERPANLSAAPWDNLLPPGEGFIPIPDPAAYGLPLLSATSASSGALPTATWGVSVFHQLHCVTMLRQIFWADRDHRATDPAMLRHAAHCFDLLRQALSCCGDTALEMEQVRLANGDVVPATYISPRRCRDIDEIRRLMAEIHETGAHANGKAHNRLAV